jgi:hypothetical protein
MMVAVPFVRVKFVCDQAGIFNAPTRTVRIRDLNRMFASGGLQVSLGLRFALIDLRFQVIKFRLVSTSRVYHLA